MTTQTTIEVVHQERDGYHLFTSPAITGLRVGSRDCRKAYEDVTASIQYLMKENHGVDCVASPEMTFEEFIAPDAIEPSQAHAAVRPFHLVHAAAQ